MLCALGLLALPRGGGRGTGGVLETALLGASAGRLLHQYTLSIAGQPTSLDAESASVMHFLLGFDALTPPPADAEASADF